MTGAVADLLGDPEARQRLAGAAARWVGRFDWREIARVYVELVRKKT